MSALSAMSVLRTWMLLAVTPATVFMKVMKMAKEVNEVKLSPRAKGVKNK